MDKERKPMISVLVPLYNVEKYIARCLDSILSQSFQNFEIIIVNDGSLDTSIEIALKYAEKDNRIKIIFNEENMGLAWARMVGYRNATGQYIVFCDSDDFLPINSLEVLYRSIKKSDAEIVCGNYQIAFSNETFGKISNNRISYGTDAKSVYKALLLNEVNHSLWGKIYNKNILKNFNYVTKKGMVNGEDAFLFYQILQNVNKVHVISDIVYYYFQNTESSTKVRLSKKAIKNIIDCWNFRDTILKDNSELSPLVHEKLLNSYCILLKDGYDKHFIDSQIDIAGFLESIKFKKLLKNYSLKKSLKYFMMINLFGNSFFLNLMRKLRDENSNSQ